MSRRRTSLSMALAMALPLLGCSGEIAPATGDSSKASPDPAKTPAGGSDSPFGGPAAPGAGSGGNPAGPGPAACTPAAPPRARVWRLSHNQLKNTLLDVFGYTGKAVDALPPDARFEGFGNRADKLALSPLLMEHYFSVGDEISAEVLRRSGDFLKCAPAALGEGSCLDDFLASVGRRLWRRTLADDERQALAGVYAAAAKADGAETGLKSVIQAMLLSPNFLFRTELGPAGAASGAVVPLTDFELASSLAYTLWDAPPDNELLDLAAAGGLHDATALVAQAKRLFLSPKRAPDAMGAFMRQWLKIDDLADQEKDPTLFPFYTAGTGQDLLQEMRLLFDDVVFNAGGDRTVRTLFTASRGYANARTAAIYGVGNGGSDLSKVDLDPKRRRGLLTTGAFLAGHAGADATKVVDRGAFVREEFLCADVPAPPQNFKFEDANITEDMTAREKLLLHAKNPACDSCHALFDGIGFALENYDAVGRWRDTEKNKKIDSTGALPLPSGGELHFENFVDLVDQLAKGPDIYNCFATQYLSYATGRYARDIDACERDSLLATFAASGYRVDGLVVGLVTSPAFSTRKN